MAGTRLTFDIFAKDHASEVFDKFGRTVKDSGTETERASKKWSTGSKHVAGLVGAFAGYQVGQKFVSFLKDANAEARESQKVNANTANVIKITGGVAKVSAKDIRTLATTISNKTAVDDEQVQMGSNLLLTFKNVRNEVGKGSKIFDRATAAAVDLSAAGFGDVEGAAKMLGKSLNDPIAGVSALGEAGVTFTDEQKKQIKAMVANGNTLGAQKIIMKEVESQVKGSASAQATATEKMTNSWNNFKEMIGTKMLPVIDAAAGKLTSITNWAMENPGAVYAIAAAFAVLAVAFVALTSPVTLVIGALAALSAGLVWLYTKNKDFANGVNFAWKNIIKPVLSAWKFYYTDILFPVLKMLWTGVIKPVFGWIAERVPGVWNNHIKPAFDKMRIGVGKVKDAFADAKDGIKSTWSKVTSAITGPLDVAKKALNRFFRGVDKIASFFGKSFNFRFDVGSDVKTTNDHSSGAQRNFTGGIGPKHLAAADGAIGGKGNPGGGRVWPANTKTLSGNYAGHSGVDIAAGMGSPIKAAASGKIDYVGWGRGYGQAIFQRFGDGSSAVYGHTSKTLVRAGQSVRAGQRIGLVGSTGRSTGPHLHFEVNKAGPFGSAANRAATLAWLGGSKMTSGSGFSLPGLPSLSLPGWLGGLGGAILGMGKSWVKSAVFDTGGMLPSGTAAVNLSGRPERVLNPRETADLTPAAIGAAVAAAIDGKLVAQLMLDGQMIEASLRLQERKTRRKILAP